MFLEASSPLYHHATDFLVAISEVSQHSHPYDAITAAQPLSRPRYVHEYKITTSSLYAAASIGFSAGQILTFLERLSKAPVPEVLQQHIALCTSNFGKVKLVIRQQRYFVESADPQALDALNADDGFQATRCGASYHHISTP